MSLRLGFHLTPQGDCEKRKTGCLLAIGLATRLTDGSRVLARSQNERHQSVRGAGQPAQQPAPVALGVVAVRLTL